MQIVKSISGSTDYRDICNLAAYNNQVFQNFRTHPNYVPILDHVSERLGKRYLEEIEKDRRFDLSKYQNFLKNDLFGGPITVKYKVQDMLLDISPTTLRYAKVANDILKYFPVHSINSIVEIGVGYGGQCRILDSLLNFDTYTLFDIKPALRLAQRYLENFLLNNYISYITINEKHAPSYDLCISNYAFSELSRDTQDKYIETIVKKSKMGYMTYNYITKENYQTYTADEFAKMVNGFIIPEIPLTHPSNCIIVWGVDNISMKSSSI